MACRADVVLPRWAYVLRDKRTGCLIRSYSSRWMWKNSSAPAKLLDRMSDGDAENFEIVKIGVSVCSSKDVNDLYWRRRMLRGV
jgi:hypothetical protein